LSKVTFRNLPDETAEFVSVDNDTLLGSCYSYAKQQDKKLYDIIMSQKVVIQLNGEIQHPDVWISTKVSRDDLIVLYPQYGSNESGGFLSVAIGAILIIFTPLKSVGYALLISGALSVISSALFSPDLPQLTASTSSSGSQTYNWSGISTIASNEAPIPIVYGTHAVGGNLISAYVLSEGKDSYLYMLLALCEGEIEGICQYSDNTSICTTSDINSTSSNDSLGVGYKDPAILINDQPLYTYTDISWWYRTGTNNVGANNEFYPFEQNIIPYFDGARALYTLEKEITLDGTTYTTTKEVNKVLIQVKAPALYKITDSGFASQSVKYSVSYKEESEETWHSATIIEYLVGYKAISGVIENIWAVRYTPWETYASGIRPETYRVKVYKDTTSYTSYSGVSGGNRNYTDIYTIYLQCTNTVTKSITYLTVNCTNHIYYNTSTGYESNSWTNEVAYIGDYTIWVSPELAKVGNEIEIYSTVYSSSADSRTMTDSSKSAVWDCFYLDFDSLTYGLGKGIYSIKLQRTTGVSSDYKVADSIQLYSITEVTSGNFIYPNTALLGLKIKATDQLSGSIPNIITTIKGKKISVPSLSGTGTFDSAYYSSTNSRFETSGGVERTWDEVTYKTEYSNNSILCVRDLVLNKRFGLGNYLSSSDLNTSEMVANIKTCHVSYDPYDGNQPDYIGWYSVINSNLWTKYWWGSAWENTGAVTSSATNRQIILSGAYGYTVGFRLSSTLSVRGTYTLILNMSRNGRLNVNAYGAASKDNFTNKTNLVWLGSNTCNTGSGNVSVTITCTNPNIAYIGLNIFALGDTNDRSVTISDASMSGTIKEHYHTFDGVLETQQAAITSLAEMCNSFRCWPVWKNGVISFIINKNDTPIHTLSLGNIIKDSFSQSFTNLTEIPYILEGQYIDASDDYQQKLLSSIAEDTDLIKSTKSSIGLKGIVNRQKAERELKFKHSNAINSNHVINFKVGLDYIHASAGDIVNISHTLPGWGNSGRILSYNATNKTVSLEATYTFTDVTATYLIKYQTSDNNFVTATILNGNVSQTASLQNWPDSEYPKSDAVYAIGKKSTYIKPYRLTEVKRSKVDEVDLTLVNHIPSVYTEPTISIIENNDTDLSNPTTIKLAKPTNISIVALNSSGEIGFNISAICTNADYIIVEFSVTNNGTYESIGSIYNNTLKYINNSLATNATYYFRLQGKTNSGIGSAYSYVSCFLPNMPTDLVCPSGICISGYMPNTHKWDGKDITIFWNPVSLNSSTDSVDGYIVKIYYSDPNDESKLLRTEYVNTTQYTYTYDTCLSDANNTIYGGYYNKLYFKIATRSRNGGESEYSLPFEAYNSPPIDITGLTASGIPGGVKFEWNKGTDLDHRYYQYSYDVSGEGYSAWVNLENNYVSIVLTSAQLATAGNKALITCMVRDVDWHGQYSSSSSASENANSVDNQINVGNFTISGSLLYSDYFFLDSENSRMRLGHNSGTYVELDGASMSIQSSNYVSGYLGAGFILNSNLLEVGNIVARGVIHASVFQKDSISVVGGSVLIRPADVLDEAMTALDSCTMTIKGDETFSVGDILRIKDGGEDEWFQVTATGEEATMDSYSESNNSTDYSIGYSSPAVDTLMDSYASSNQTTDSFMYSGYVLERGQTFTGNGESITKVSFYIKKVGSPTGTMSAVIYAHTGTWGTSGLPTGAALGTSATVDVATGLTTSYQIVTFTFSSPVATVNGTRYVTTLQFTSTSSDASNDISIGVDGTPEDEGNGVYYNIATSAWLTSIYDRIYYVYYTVAAGTPTSIRGQSITGNGSALTKASFYLKKTSSPTGSAYAKLYAHSGTFGVSSVPTGEALATSDAFDVSTLTTDFALTDFTFSSPYTTVDDTNYVVTIEFSGSSATDYIVVGGDSISPTHNGNSCDYISSYTAYSSVDLCFYTYYTDTSSGAYTVSRDKNAMYEVDTNPAWSKGTCVTNFGQSGDGGIYLTSSETNAPYISMFTHAGSPWTTLTTQLRLGNLNGSYGYSSAIYGLAAGQYATASKAWFSIEQTNGLRIGVNTTVYSQWDTSGNAYFGNQAGYHTKVSSSGVEVKSGSTVLSSFGSTVLIGRASTSQNNILISSGAMYFRNNTTNLISIDSSASAITVGQTGTGKHNISIDDTYIRMRSATSDVVWVSSVGSYFSNSAIFSSSVTYDANNYGKIVMQLNESANPFSYITIYQAGVNIVDFRLSNASSEIVATLKTTYDSNDYALITVTGANNASNITFTADANGTLRSMGYNTAGLVPSTDRGISLGYGTSYQWDQLWVYNVNEEADFFFLDDRDDLAELAKIKGSGKYDPISGLEFIDDNTLPEWALVKAAEDMYNPFTKELMWKKGDIMKSSRGNPSMSSKIWPSWLRGSLMQLYRDFNSLKEDYENLKKTLDKS
jgi:hypothetical protein